MSSGRSNRIVTSTDKTVNEGFIYFTRDHEVHSPINLSGMFSGEDEDHVQGFLQKSRDYRKVKKKSRNTKEVPMEAPVSPAADDKDASQEDSDNDAMSIHASDDEGLYQEDGDEHTDSVETGKGVMETDSTETDGKNVTANTDDTPLMQEDNVTKKTITRSQSCYQSRHKQPHMQRQTRSNKRRVASDSMPRMRQELPPLSGHPPGRPPGHPPGHPAYNFYMGKNEGNLMTQVGQWLPPEFQQRQAILPGLLPEPSNPRFTVPPEQNFLCQSGAWRPSPYTQGFVDLPINGVIKQRENNHIRDIHMLKQMHKSPVPEVRPDEFINKAATQNRANSQKVCNFAASNQECPYKERCKFSHDIAKVSPRENVEPFPSNRTFKRFDGQRRHESCTQGQSRDTHVAHSENSRNEESCVPQVRAYLENAPNHNQRAPGRSHGQHNTNSPAQFVPNEISSNEGPSTSPKLPNKISPHANERNRVNELIPTSRVLERPQPIPHAATTSPKTLTSQAIIEPKGQNILLEQMEARFEDALTNHRLGEGFDVVCDIREKFKRINVRILERLLIACGSLEEQRSTDIALRTFNLIKQERDTLKEEDFKYLVAVLCANGDLDLATEKIDEMKEYFSTSPSGEDSKANNTLADMLKMFLDGSSKDYIRNSEKIFYLWEDLESHQLLKLRLIDELLTIDANRRYLFEKLTANGIAVLYKKILKDKYELKPASKEQLVRLLFETDGPRYVLDIILNDHHNTVPPDVLHDIIATMTHPDLLLKLVKVMTRLSPNAAQEIDHEVWNRLLSKCSCGKMEQPHLAQQLYGCMDSNAIRLNPQSAFLLLKLVLRLEQNQFATEFLKKISSPEIYTPEFTELVLEHIRDLPPTERIQLKSVFLLMVKNRQRIPEAVIEDQITCLIEDDNYSDVYRLTVELHRGGYVLTYGMYFRIWNILEEWEDNVDAAVEVYAYIRHLYPHKRTALQRQRHSSTSSTTHQNVPVASHQEPKQTPPPVPTDSIKVKKQEIHDDVGTGPKKDQPTDLVNTPKCNSPSRLSVSSGITSPSFISPEDSSYSHVNRQDSAYHSESRSTDSSLDPSPMISDTQDRPETKGPVQVNIVDEVAWFISYRINCSHNFESDKECSQRLSKVLQIGGHPGQSFQKFVDLLIEKIKRDRNPVWFGCTSSESGLTQRDEIFFGRLGVVLIEECAKSKQFEEGYKTLFALHGLGINYSFISDTLSQVEVLALACDVCLNLNPPRPQAAMEVLRGSNYGIPLKGQPSFSEAKLLTRMKMFSRVIECLIASSLHKEACEIFEKYELFQQKPLEKAQVFANEILLKLSQGGEIDLSSSLYACMEQNLISRDNNVFRAYLNCCAIYGKYSKARQLFFAGCLQGLYPQTYNVMEPALCRLRTDLTKVEIVFLVEKHLSSMLGQDDAVIVSPDPSSEEEDVNVFTFLFDGVWDDKVLEEAKLRLEEAVTTDINPPLIVLEESAGTNNRVRIAMASIRRWLRAVPAASRHRLNIYTSNNVASDTVPSVAKRSTEIEIPYFQPGMSVDNELHVNVTHTEDVRDVNMETQSRSSSVSDGSSHSSTERKMRAFISKAICRRLTYFMRKGMINEEDFKSCAKTLLSIFIRRQGTIYYNESVKQEAYEFVNNYFKQGRVRRL